MNNDIQISIKKINKLLSEDEFEKIFYKIIIVFNSLKNKNDIVELIFFYLKIIVYFFH